MCVWHKRRSSTPTPTAHRPALALAGFRGGALRILRLQEGGRKQEGRAESCAGCVQPSSRRSRRPTHPTSLASRLDLSGLVCALHPVAQIQTVARMLYGHERVAQSRQTMSSLKPTSWNLREASTSEEGIAHAGCSHCSPTQPRQRVCQHLRSFSPAHCCRIRLQMQQACGEHGAGGGPSSSSVHANYDLAARNLSSSST